MSAMAARRAKIIRFPTPLPKAPAREHPGGSAVAGLFQVMPPSVERQIPAWLTVCESIQAVARTMLGWLGLMRTSDIQKGSKPSRCAKWRCANVATFSTSRSSRRIASRTSGNVFTMRPGAKDSNGT